MDGKFKIFVIVAIAVLAASICGSTFFIMKSMGNSNSQDVVANGKEEQPVKLVEIAVGDAIMTNMAMESNNIQHFAKIKISIGVDATDEAAVEEFKKGLEAKSASIRSEIIDTIGEQTYSMLSNPTSGKVKLSDEIIPRLNQLLGTEMIKEIYFEEYFVQ